MAVQGHTKKADAKARPSKSGGLGKKKKIFPESLGKDHLIELSNSIADSYSTKLQERVEKAKGKANWEKEKRVEKMRGKAGVKQSSNGEASKTDDMKGKKQPLSKSSIRASLVSKQREKSKQRKDARKAALKASEQQTSSTSVAAEGAQMEPRRKRVSFV